MWGDRFVWLMVAGISLCFAVDGFTQPPLAMLDCVPNDTNHPEYSKADYCAVFFLRLERGASDFGVGIARFVENHHDGLIAFGTLMIAGFTGTLWWVTWGMVGIARNQREDSLRVIKATENTARAAQRSAEVAMSVEWPMVFLSGLELITEGPPFGRGLSVEGVPPDGANPVATFRNYGRTPAIVIDICLQHWIGAALPPMPRYTLGVDLPSGTIIKEREGELRHNPLLAIPVSDAQRLAMRVYKADLWVYGMIRFQDFMGGRHTHRFCGLWHGVDPSTGSDTPNGFIEAGPQSYRGNTYEPPTI